VVKLAQFSTGGVAHYCIGGNNQLEESFFVIKKWQACYTK